MTRVHDPSRNVMMSVAVPRRGFIAAMGLYSAGLALSACATDDNRSTGTTSQGDIGSRLKAVGDRVLTAPSGTRLWRYGNSFGLPLSAFVTKDNDVVFSQEIFDLCENDGQIGAVMVQRVALFQAIPGGLAIPQIAAPLNLPPQTSTIASATTQADTLAIRTLAAKGFDPRDALEVWTRIGRVGGQLDPVVQSRLDAMKAQLRALGYQV